jgi:NDP-mannose synthase
MQALILAGGRGTRLRPYTTVFPKPLMPIGDHPILEIILRQLNRAGARQVILAVGHMGQMFRAFFGDGAALGLDISYSFENQALGTAGPIALALGQLEEDFLVMNGDLLTTLAYRELFEDHCRTNAAATVAVHRREVKIDFGVIETEGDEVAKYTEKPTFHFDVSMGVNVFKKRDLKPFLVPGEYLDIPDLLMRMRGDGKLVRCFRSNCQWLDIGRIDDYEAASGVFEARRTEFLPDGTK